jgi:hypothetical protein
MRWGISLLGPTLRPDIAVRLTRAWAAERRSRPAYRVLSEAELRATRRSDTAFVFGSGRSLVEIGADEWARISACDTIGFSHFHLQRWVRVDYHLVMEIVSADETAASFRANPNYADTVYGLMQGWVAEASNELVGRRLLPAGARIFRWRRVARGRSIPPSRSFRDGVVHGTNSVHDVVNFAVLAGWKRIVIAGVDLYNKEYFWLPPEVTREDERPQYAADSRWVQADAMIETFRLWREVLEREGIELFVYNERSLLAGALPVFSWQR